MKSIIGRAARAVGVRTPKQRAGDAAEEAAARYLQENGCRVIARNVRYREGELDLIARDANSIIFVEVRLRSDPRYGGGSGSVDRFKQKRLAHAAQRWLAEHYGERWPACRFDVVTLDADGTIGWIRDAFAVE